MPFDHDTVVGFSKSFGLFYLVLMSLGVLAYVFWPANKKRFDAAAQNPLNDPEDKPWH